MIINNLSFKLSQAVNNELDATERIVWLDQPPPYKIIQGTLFALVFFVPWNFAAIPKFYESVKNGNEIILILFSLPFVAVGIWGLFLPFTAWYAAKNTVYVITNKRAFSLLYLYKKKTYSFFPGPISTIKKTQNKNGTGSLTVYKQTDHDSKNSKDEFEYKIEAIKNVNHVEQLIKELCAEKNKNRI